MRIIQLVASPPFESKVTSYNGDLIVIVRFGVVSGVVAAVAAGGWGAGAVGAGCGVTL